MRASSTCIALVCGLATFATISAANAGGCCDTAYTGWGAGGCGCGTPVVDVAPVEAYPVATAYVAQPVFAAPAYADNETPYPYLHGDEFFNRNYYSVGGYGNPLGYRGYYHPYAEITYSGLPGVGSGVVPVRRDYLRARHQPEWRLAPPHYPRRP